VKCIFNQFYTSLNSVYFHDGETWWNWFSADIYQIAKLLRVRRRITHAVLDFGELVGE
jgi:hypothetical protein